MARTIRMTDSISRLDALVVFVLLILLGFVLYALVYQPIPKDNMTLFAALSTGTVGMGLGSYIGYRFGSSKGSTAKDDAITELTKKVPDQ